MGAKNLGFPDDRRGKAPEVVSREVPDPVVEVSEDADHVYVTAEFREGNVELVVEALRVLFRGPGIPGGRHAVDLPSPVLSEPAAHSVRNGVVDLVLRKSVPAPPTD